MRDVGEWLVRVFANRQSISQHLSGMPFVSQPVEDRDACALGKLLNVALMIAAELDAVEHAAQDACRVCYRLFVANL